MKYNKSKKVNDLRGMILGLEMNLKLLSDDLEEVDKNLTYLDRLQEDLIYNINLHRGNTVITVAKEYKRSIDDLERVKDEILKWRNFRTNVTKKMEKKLKSYDYYLNEYEKAFDELNKETVILLFRKDRDSE